MSTTATSTWPTGTNDYARRLAHAAGVIEARDLKHGDVILKRAPGAVERTPHRVGMVWGEGRDVVVHWTSGEVSRISKDVCVKLA